MSRTIRFRKDKFIPWWNDYKWKEWEYIRANETIDPSWEVRQRVVVNRWSGVGAWYRVKTWYERRLVGKEYKKKVYWKQHKDQKFNCKDPGPHYWRNLVSDRPMRRFMKAELRKFLYDVEYEVPHIKKYKLDYWM